MGLYINQLEEKFKDFIVTVTLPNGIGQIQGFYTEDTFSFSTSASWEKNGLTGDLSSAGKSFAEGLASKIPGVGDMAKNWIGTQYKQISNTVELYDGAGDISLSFKFNVILGVHHQDYKSIETMLAKVTQPKLDGKAMKPNVYDSDTILIELPQGNLGAMDKTMASISIGDWFNADLLRITSIDRTYSTILTEDGKPLYLQLSISASPYRTITDDELSRWFK